MSEGLPVAYNPIQPLIAHQELVFREILMNITRIQATLQAYFTEDRRWAHPDRRLVFWYDDNAQFQEIFTNLQLPGITKLQLADLPFTTKYRLLIQEPTDG